MISLVLVLCLFPIWITITSATDLKVMCYYGTWATYRHGNGKFDVANINPHLCTHAYYTFFGVEEDGSFKVLDPYLDLEENYGRGNIKLFNNLKNINPNLKTMAAVGGWNEGSLKYSNIAKSEEKRQKFATEATEFLLKHNFDGLDIDWEYPAQRGGDTNVDRLNFNLFLKAIKIELDKHDLLLSIAVASVEFSAGVSYDIPQVSELVDFINVMTYDMHGSFDTTLGINAPLYSGPQDITDKEKQLNVYAAIQYWISQGASREKLMLGIPLYGRTFTLSDNSQTTPGSPFNGPGNAGLFTATAGTLGYNEFCELKLSQPWTRVWEDTQKVPYAFHGNQWIGYDDEESIQIKGEFAISEGLGGLMVWSLETDDFRGICGDVTYPLLRTINSVVRDDVVIPEDGNDQTTISTTSTTSTSTTTDSMTNTDSGGSTAEASTNDGSNDSECFDGEAAKRSPDDCNTYLRCNHGSYITMNCPVGLVFDNKIVGCNWPGVDETC